MESRTVRPLAYVCGEADGVMLKLEMPGVSKDGLDLSVDGDVLTVKGSRSDTETGEQARYVVRERLAGDYAHTFTLDQTIDRDSIEARMENGVLTIHLHLREEQKPRKISVRTE